MAIQSEYSVKRPIDDELIEKIAQGDMEAFRELYNSASKSVYSFALSILKNSQDAEDVMQETFLKIYQKSPGYISCGKPLAWILRITRNLSLTCLRKKCAETDSNQPEKPDFSCVENTEHRLLLEKLFSILDEEEKQIVVLHIVGGLKHRETAEIIGLPLGTVLSKYNRAIKKLKAGTED